MRNKFTAVMTIAAGLAFANAALAQSPAEALENARMLGHWATRCSEPASPTNPHLYFEPSGDGAVYRLVLNESRQLTRQISAARFVPPSTVTARIVDVGGAGFVDVTMLRQGDQFRTMRSVGSDSTVNIDNGILANGQPSTWQNRCN